MEHKPFKQTPAADVRRAAERRLRERRGQGGGDVAGIDTQRLVHELQIHQIELEMQNEELQQARDAMEAGLEKYSDLYDFAPVAYLTLDREGYIREANLTATTFFGIERGVLMHRNLGLSLLAEDQTVLTAFLERIFQDKFRDSCEVTIRRSGRPLTSLRIEAAVTASGRECRAAMTDITESRRAERYRTILGKLESTGSLAGGLANDYGELLATILLNLELAQTLTRPDELFLARRIEAASNAARAAQDLTRQLVALAPEATATERVPVALPEVLQTCSDAVLNGHPVHCRFLLPDNLWPVEVEVGQLGQALRQVILNARDAMPRGGEITIHAENVCLRPTGVQTLTAGDYVRLSISDRGDGMPETTQPRIFDPYFTTKPRGHQPGRGLGLTICQALIRKHGGSIDVESAEGVGTTFHVDLPALPPTTPKALSPAALVRSNPIHRPPSIRYTDPGRPPPP